MESSIGSPGAEPERGESGLGESDQRQLIGRSFYVYSRARSLVALATPTAALVARYALGIEAIDVGRFAALSAAIALYNALAWTYFRTFRDAHAPEAAPRLLAVTYGAVVLDFLALTAAVWLLGGGRSPFTAFYLLHVMVSCVLLSRRAALTLTGIAYALLVAQVAAEWAGLARPWLPRGAVAGDEPLSGLYAVTLVLVHGLLFWLSAFLLLALVRSLRRYEKRMRLANAELTRLSQQRKDFLHIAAHNLRAPLGAVTMLLESMRADLAGPTTEKQRGWLDRCLRRLADLGEFMTSIETLTSLESDIIRTHFGPVRLPELAARLVEEYADVAAAHHQQLRLELDAGVPPVVGHERLLQEAVVNYLTNALKYTPDGGHVVVRVLHRPPAVRVEVCDDGPGIAAEDQGRLFQELVRIQERTPEGRRLKGSGLGLSIVRRIALAHGGRTGSRARRTGGAPSSSSCRLTPNERSSAGSPELEPDRARGRDLAGAGRADRHDRGAPPHRERAPRGPV
jgi:signal transduction histidine kinase